MVARFNEMRKNKMAINPKWGGSTTVGTKPSSGKTTISIPQPAPPYVFMEGDKKATPLFPGVSKFTGQGRIMGKSTPLSTGESILGVARKGGSFPFAYNWTGSKTRRYRNLKNKFSPGGRRAVGGTGFAPGGRIAAALRGE